jgi:hypothetical protein
MTATRTEYQMTQADLDGILETINSARNAPCIAIHLGMPRSTQEAANDAWCALGQHMGFDGMTVEPCSKGDLFFTAVPN